MKVFYKTFIQWSYIKPEDIICNSVVAFYWKDYVKLYNDFILWFHQNGSTYICLQIYYHKLPQLWITNSFCIPFLCFSLVWESTFRYRLRGYYHGYDLNAVLTQKTVIISNCLQHKLFSKMVLPLSFIPMIPLNLNIELFSLCLICKWWTCTKYNYLLSIHENQKV